MLKEEREGRTGHKNMEKASANLNKRRGRKNVLLPPLQASTRACSETTKDAQVLPAERRGGALSFNSFTRSNQEYLNNACGASIAFNSTGVFGPSGLKDKLPPFELEPRSNLMELEM